MGIRDVKIDPVETALKWQQLKMLFPVGLITESRVLAARPFGLFIDVGYDLNSTCELTGIIDIVISKSLPLNHNLWPAPGDLVRAEVIGHRDRSKEVELRLISKV